ncbi:MAG TPA: 4'-phosphopantetheinyl transferase superfamily protein [Bacteroidaceae bacterium]|nr:4'-phosphopantetheinyl transferase superfamily protein [Bacteroidaceae bacterium]
MPIFQKIVDDTTYQLALWHITETLDQLFRLCPSNNLIYYKELVELVRVEKRKKELLVSRLLVNQLCGGEQKVTYRTNGQPYLVSTNQSISISHSGEYVAVILSDSPNVGVDIEAYSDKALRVASKFMHPKDVLPSLLLGSPNFSLEVKQHVLAWSAKEAFFKYVGSEKLVDYKHYLTIQADDDKLIAKEFATEQRCQAHVYYRMEDNYVLTWVV